VTAARTGGRESEMTINLTRAAWRRALRANGLQPTREFLDRFLAHLALSGRRATPFAFARAFDRAPKFRPIGRDTDVRYAAVGGAVVAFVPGCGESGGRTLLTLVSRSGRVVPDAEGEAQDQIIPPYMLVTRTITAPREGTSYRGITKATRNWARGVYQRWLARENASRAGRIDPATGQPLPPLVAQPIDVGHATPHVLVAPGQTVRVRPELRSPNRAGGGPIRTAAANRRANPSLGLYTRPVRKK